MDDNVSKLNKHRRTPSEEKKFLSEEKRVTKGEPSQKRISNDEQVHGKDLVNRDITKINKEDASKGFDILMNYGMIDDPTTDEKQEAEDALIKYFNNSDRLEEKDVEGNNAFHWAVKIGSIKAWKTFHDILDNNNKNNNHDLLTERNVNGIGETPWELVFEAQDGDFIKNVLLDESKRCDNSPIIGGLKEKYKDNIEGYKNDSEFITQYAKLQEKVNRTISDGVIEVAYKS